MEQILDPLISRMQMKNLLKIRLTNRAGKAAVDDEITHRHIRTFGKTQKSIGLMIKDLITYELRETLSTSFADLKESDVGYGLALLDPRLYGEDSQIITPGYTVLRNYSDDDGDDDGEYIAHFDVKRLIGARDGMIKKYPEFRATLIYNFHIILADIRQLWKMKQLLEREDEDDPLPTKKILTILKQDPLFNKELLKDLIVKIKRREYDMDLIRGPTKALVSALRCPADHRRMGSTKKYLRRCGFVANKSLLKLLSSEEYGVSTLSTGREDFERLFHADNRLDDNDISLLREYMEYRIRNGSIYSMADD